MNGVKNGMGKYLYDTGNSYDGVWLNDKEHGEGTFTYADGRVARVLYENGEYVTDI